ncbi:MAG: regulatory protein RecX [Candidatus Methylomirabilia bacterium]
MTAPVPERTAFAAALALLTGRALTVGELAARLRRKGYDPETISETTARLLELGYLDDRRTAVAWAEHAVQTRGFGPRRLREGLARRHLPRELVDETVAGCFGAGEELGFALAVLDKWERTKGPAADTAGRHAAYAHLRRRGFSGAAARAALFNREEFE